MRKGLAALGLAGVLAAGPALAAPPPAPNPRVGGQGAALAAQDAALAFYPPAARAAGLDGQATLRCTRNRHMALKGCVLVSETPVGQGFGAAALAMAARSPDNPQLDFADEPGKPARDLAVRFGQHPPAIEPDVTRMAHVRIEPSILTPPSPAQIQAAYPERALADQVAGAAAIDCGVTAAGKLTGCRLDAELPGGYGFGQATLDLAGDWVMKPRTLDGAPVGGATVRIGVRFVPGDPSAPLSLPAGPAP